MMYHYYLYDKKLQNILSYFCCYQQVIIQVTVLLHK